MLYDLLFSLFLVTGIPLFPVTEESLAHYSAFLHRHDLSGAYDTVLCGQWSQTRAYVLETIFCPPSVDVDRLPSLRWLISQRETTDRHLELLRKRMEVELDRLPWLEETERQLLWIREVYLTAENAVSFRDIYWRRISLGKLRTLAPGWYHSGTLPPAYPFWRNP